MVNRTQSINLSTLEKQATQSQNLYYHFYMFDHIYVLSY